MYHSIEIVCKFSASQNDTLDKLQEQHAKEMEKLLMQIEARSQTPDMSSKNELVDRQLAYV